MIEKLSERISNMIAAGEVVTRPANALKEIIENALDAKATIINIDLLGNGLKQIQVVDNGIGMDEANLKKAFLRHATSKIKNEYDLAHIFTLGFRGEAIPAIAAVSKMTIKSKTKTSLGSQVVYHGGDFVSQGAVAVNQGTVVIIKDLFYNVPARLKFIKSPQTELSHLIEVCEEFMLAYPDVSFKLTHEGKTLRQSLGDSDYIGLFEHIFGKNASANMLVIEEKTHDIKINAYLVSPEVTRASKKNIYIYLNNRVIKNYVLTNALIEGYHTRLMTNRYPIAVVKITIDPILVDVNVHPQKREVKIANEYFIASLIRNLVRLKFSKAKMEFKETAQSYTQISGFDYIINELELDYKEIKKQNLKKAEQLEKLPYFEFIGQFAGTYLLFQNDQGLYLIDQHAAAERIRYEIYYEKLGEAPIVKGLLIPFDLELRPVQESIVGKHLKEFEKIGIYLKQVKSRFQVTQIPIWLNDDDINLFVETVIDSLEKYKAVNLKDLRDSLAKSIACKGAIKANEALSLDEVNHLIAELRKTENPYFCPHGRPVSVFFSHYQIEKLFKRVV